MRRLLPLFVFLFLFNNQLSAQKEQEKAFSFGRFVTAPPPDSILFDAATGSVRTQKMPQGIQCGSDVMHDVLWSKFPDRAAAQQALDDVLARRFREKQVQAAERGAVLELPVVIHLVHDGAAGNLSDTRVRRALDNLNAAFAHTGYYAGAGAGVDAGIRFCLARRTPDNKATTGINRVESPLTRMTMESQDLSLKNLIRWDPRNYINIWVVESINSVSSGPGVAGYAYLPASHGRPEDGMVCEAQFFGASPQEDMVLVHEMGHYLGLYHTFQGGCKNDDCLMDGDRVCDTPPDQAKHTACPVNSCQTDTDAPSPNPFGADRDDMTENFMDYSPFECVYRFTQGQGERMQMSVKTIRASLLQSNGCSEACNPIVKAGFSIDPAGSVVAGTTANLNNQSTGAARYEWWIDGKLVSTDQNPAYLFRFPGVFSITMKAFSDQEGCADSSSTLYTVTCPVTASFTAAKTILKAGEAGTFTSTATGGGALEWFVNGVAAGSGSVLNFVFLKDGIYNVVLKVTHAVCSEEFGMAVEVTRDCVSVGKQWTFGTPQGELRIYDVQALPNGNVVACGDVRNQKAVAILYNSNGDILWCKQANAAVSQWVNVNTLPDGSFILLGDGMINGQQKSSVTQLDVNGKVGKFLIFENSFNFGGDVLRSRLLPESDGTLLATIPLESSTPKGSQLLMLKFDLKGTVFWSKKYENANRCDLVKSKNSYLLSRLYDRSPFIYDFVYEVFHLNGQGDVIDGKGYEFVPKLNWSAANSPRLFAHEDGGYIISSMANTQPNFTTTLTRCAPNGDIVWSNQYLTTGSKSFGHRLHYFKGKGWFLHDVGATATSTLYAHTLLRIKENGDLHWHKKFKPLASATSFTYVVACEQAGRIRLLINQKNKATLFANLPDSTGAVDCLTENSETTLLAKQYTHNVIAVNPLVSSNISLNITTSNLFVSDLPLQPNTLCAPPPPICPEICDNALDDDKDGYVDCYDADCQCIKDDKCVANNLDPDTAMEAKLSWESLEGGAVHYATPLVANLNPQTDSIPEIIVLSSTASPLELNIFKGDGSNATSPDRLKIYLSSNLIVYNKFVVGDINSDGIPEVIVVDGDKLIKVYRDYIPNKQPCMSLWMSTQVSPPNQQFYPMLADFDQDGQTELYLGSDIYRFDFSNPAVPKLQQVLRGQLTNGDGNTNNVVAADLLTPADCNGDPDCDGLELAAGSIIYSIDLDLLDGDGYQIKAAKNLNVLQSSHQYLDGYTTVADVDLDKVPDLVTYSGRRQGNTTERGVYVWNKAGLVQFFKLPSNMNYWDNGPATIGNVYDDTYSGYAQDYPEIMVTDAYKLLCLNVNKAKSSPTEPYWWTSPNNDHVGYTGCSLFDFDGDNQYEVVYRDERYLRILYGGHLPLPAGTDTERNYWKTPMASGTGDEFPVIADVDNNGAADIVVTGVPKDIPPGSVFQGSDSRLSVFKSANIPWMPCRPIWNQYNYHPLLINDDLSVPAHQQRHWLEFPGPGGGKYPFNTAMVQLPSLSSTFSTAGYPVPDVAAALDTFYCEQNLLRLRVTLCNTGSAVLPAGTPLQFYDNDPTKIAATRLGVPLLLPNKLDKDSCLVWQINAPLPASGQLWAIINDNGSLNPPFDMTKKFPSTHQPECNYSNNLFHLTISIPNASLDLGPDQILCSSSITTLKANSGFARYRWNDGSPDTIFTAPGPGIYWVDAWDICGEKHTDTVHIRLQNTSLELGADHTICRGDSVRLSANGFDQVQWSPRNALDCSECPTVLLRSDSSLLVRVTGQSGNCIASDSVWVRVGDFPRVNALVSPNSCGQQNGSIILTPVDPASNLTYRWQNGEKTPALDRLAAGIYHVTISHAAGCSVSATYEVLPGSGLLLSDTLLTPVRCFGEANGGVSVAVTGGSAPYQYQWSHNPAATGASQSGLTAGVYRLTMSDAKGCSSEVSVELLQPPQLSLAAQMDSVNCQRATANIAATAGGGTSPHTFIWSTGAKTPAVTGLPPGTYTLTLTDANGCSATRLFTVENGGGPSLSDTLLTPVRCFGEANGGVSVAVTGGSAPYQYQWSHSPAATGASQSGLAAGVYRLTMSDAKGCRSEAVFDLTQPPQLSLTAQMDSANCQRATANIAATASGGTSPHAFLWSTGANMPAVTGLPPGTYVLTLTDANGCSTARLFTVENGGGPSLSDTLLTPVRCFGEANGGVSVAVTGGSTPYQYQWSHNPAATGVSQSGLAAGVYRLTMSDTKGCRSEAVFDLAQPPQLSLTAQMDSANCQRATANIAATASGGTSPHTFLWSTGAKTPAVTGFAPGTYTLTLTDANGCSTARSFTVEGRGPLSVQVNASDTVVVKGAKVQLAATLMPANRLAQSIVWQPSDKVVEKGLFAESAPTHHTLYRIEVTDESGCTAADSVWVKVKSADIYVPNMLSVNSTVNNSFTIYTTNTSNAHIAWLGVYSRWGELLFERRDFSPNDPSLGWQGDHKGKKVPAGVYVFMAKVVFEDGSIQMIKGDVTVF